MIQTFTLLLIAAFVAIVAVMMGAICDELRKIRLTLEGDDNGSDDIS